METVPIVIKVPSGNYCAKFFFTGSKVKSLIEPDSEYVDQVQLIDKCPLLKNCFTCGKISLNNKLNSYYCPIANSDTHCGMDEVGVLKQKDYYDNICPSLYGDRIMELIRENNKLKDVK
jgi:hypothetical protein